MMYVCVSVSPYVCTLIWLAGYRNTFNFSSSVKDSIWLHVFFSLGQRLDRISSYPLEFYHICRPERRAPGGEYVETVAAPCRPGPCTAQTNPRTETCRTVPSGRPTGGPLPATTGGAPCSTPIRRACPARARPRSVFVPLTLHRRPGHHRPPAYSVPALRHARWSSLFVVLPPLQCNYCKGQGRSNCSATVRRHVSPRRASWPPAV